MPKKIKVADLPEFDVTQYLDDDEAVAQYLTVVLEDGDASLLAAALGDIAKARGMTQIAKDAGIGRESLYKALSGDRSPAFETILKVVGALGLKLRAQAVKT